MKDFWIEWKKHLRLAGMFMKSNLAAQLEYRANFVTGIAMEAGYLIVKLLYIIVVFRAGVSINGLSPDEILLFIGTFVFMTGLYAGLIMMNLFELRNLIVDGTMDQYITKPVSLQFMVTLRRSDIGLLGLDFLAGLVLIVAGMIRLGTAPGLLRLLGFIGYMGLSGLVAYGLFVIPVLLSFWFVGANIAHAVDPIWDFNNMPMGIYGLGVRFFGTWVIPIFVVTNFPAMFLLNRMSPALAIWGIVCPVLMLALTRWVFGKAMRRYNSASS